MPCAASACSMPTWMAPKLPPPAKTKAVFMGARLVGMARIRSRHHLDADGVGQVPAIAGRMLGGARHAARCTRLREGRAIQQHEKCKSPDPGGTCERQQQEILAFAERRCETQQC